MVKIIFTILISTLVVTANNRPNYKLLKRDCLSCHEVQSIPSEIIYRRYLLTYSSKDTIKEKIFQYIKDPSKEQSIMPEQFFIKFPLKEHLDISDVVLKERIEQYIEYFDISQRLFIPN